MAHYIDTFPGRELILNNKKHLYFGGTSYLGLQTDDEFQKIFIKNVKKYGSSYGASRKSNVRISIYEKAEAYLADWVGSQACTTFSSGYLAGQLVGNFFNTESYKPFYAPNSHSALFTYNSKPYTTFTALGIALRHFLALKNNVVPVVLLDSIDFSGCNYPSFEALKSLPLQNCILVVDDSHGIGIVGENRSGVFRILQQLNPKELLVCCSLGKGLGIQAGALFGREERIAELTNTDFFGGASPAAPASLATLMQAENLYAKKRKRLARNIDLFSRSVAYMERFSHIKDHPVFSYSDRKLTEFLLENNIIVTDFNYPKEDSTSKSRIVLSAAHTKEDIEHLVKYVNVFFIK